MALGTTLLSLVRSRVVAQLERCGCPILYTLVPNFQCCPEKNNKKKGGEFFRFSRENFGKKRNFRENLKQSLR